MSTPMEIANSFLVHLSNTAYSLITDEADLGRMMPIGAGEETLAERLIIKRSPEGCIYMHRWYTSDPDSLHDHPWDSVSVIIDTGYWEVTPAGRFWRKPGDITFRKATDLHRVELETALKYPKAAHPLSLFITGPEVREWGFHTANGFVVGRDYRSVDQYRARRDAGMVKVSEALRTDDEAAP